MRKTSPRLDKTAQNNKRRPARNVKPLDPKDPAMNSKLLYAATLAVSLIGSLAMTSPASAAPLTRTEVQADLAQAIANGTLQRTDYDTGSAGSAFVSTQTHDQVVAELAAARADRKRLVGPDANRTYNPAGTAIFARSVLTRAEVKADVLQAAAAGTLQRSDYDDAASIARRAGAHTASGTFAQRVKSVIARRQS